MKKRLLLLVTSCAALIAVCVFWGWIGRQSAAPMPVPSAMGGYYQESFLLKLDAPPYGKIYYTTDGSIPTTDSAVYNGGIMIEDRSDEPNIYNAVKNIVRNWETRKPNSDPVAKGTVVRAFYVSDWGTQSEVLTQTYFVGIPAPENGYTLSLAFEYDDMFGDNGIYVTGKEYDDWYLSGDQTQPEPLPNFFYQTEIPVNAEIMDASGDVVNHTVGLRIQGASTRANAKKRFTLEVRQEYSGRETFPEALFEGASTHSVMTKAHKLEAMVAELVGDRSVGVQRSVPVKVYLNGEAWEATHFLERYDKHYFKQYYGIDNVLRVKNGEPDEEKVGEIDRYDEFMRWAGQTDFSDGSQWEAIQEAMDVQSYIDYIAINYYLCNCDFSDEKNYFVWSSTNKESSPFGDQRWRWCIYDVDSITWAAQHYDVENAAEINIFSWDAPFVTQNVNEMTLFRTLKKNEQFCRRFVTSFMDIVNNNFAVEKVEAVLLRHGLSLEWLNGYFLKRPEYAARHLAEEFQLTGTLENVTVLSENPQMGTVMVNTSEIDLSSGRWSGKYFSDYPVMITAQPEEGYRFVGWKGDLDTDSGTITLPVDGGITIEAVFERET